MSGNSFNCLHSQSVTSLVVNAGYFPSIEGMIQELKDLKMHFVSQKTEDFYGKLREICLLSASIEQFYRDHLYLKWNDALIKQRDSFKENLSWRNYNDYVAYPQDVKDSLQGLKEVLLSYQLKEEVELVDEMIGKLNVLTLKVNQLDTYREQFESIWKSVESYRSNDLSLDEVKEECIKFKENYKAY